MGQIREGAARPVAMHDTTELERLQRAERRAFYFVLVVCVAVLGYVARNAGGLL